VDVSGTTVKCYVLDTLSVSGDMKQIKENMASIRAVVYDLFTKGIGRGQVIVADDGTCSFRPEMEG
jgi:hypothetical protein